MLLPRFAVFRGFVALAAAPPLTAGYCFAQQSAADATKAVTLVNSVPTTGTLVGSLRRARSTRRSSR